MATGGKFWAKASDWMAKTRIEMKRARIFGSEIYGG
jgi:hypothetical protein